jgi:hypothetical protein
MPLSGGGSPAPLVAAPSDAEAARPEGVRAGRWGVR